LLELPTAGLARLGDGDGRRRFEGCELGEHDVEQLGHLKARHCGVAMPETELEHGALYFGVVARRRELEEAVVRAGEAVKTARHIDGEAVTEVPERLDNTR
jgi:hypothetical protein